MAQISDCYLKDIDKKKKKSEFSLSGNKDTFSMKFFLDLMPLIL